MTVLSGVPVAVDGTITWEPAAVFTVLSSPAIWAVLLCAGSNTVVPAGTSTVCPALSVTVWPGAIACGPELDVPPSPPPPHPPRYAAEAIRALAKVALNMRSLVGVVPVLTQLAFIRLRGLRRLVSVMVLAWAPAPRIKAQTGARAVVFMSHSLWFWFASVHLLREGTDRSCP